MAMEAALDAGSLLAAGLLQPLSENSRQAHQLFTPTLYLGIGLLDSNLATGLHVCLYNDDRRSRYTSKERDSEAGLDYFGVSYTYDAVTNSTGHLTSVSNSNSATNYTSFDPMGRVTASSQVTAGQTYPFTYSYNLSGSLTTESYPSGRTFTTGYDAAVFQGIGAASPDDIWNPSWAEADQETFRSYNVFRSAVASANTAIFGHQ